MLSGLERGEKVEGVLRVRGEESVLCTDIDLPLDGPGVIVDLKIVVQRRSFGHSGVDIRVLESAHGRACV